LEATAAPSEAAVRDGQRVAGVVDLRIPVLERVAAQPRRDLERAALGQMAVARQPFVAAERVHPAPM
jgi:hypothetical protein